MILFFFCFSLEDFELSLFPSISHIQQREDKEMDYWDLPNTSLIIPEIPQEDFKIDLEQMRIGTFTDCKNIINIPQKRKNLHVPPGILPDIKKLLLDLKTERNNFPVFKVFRLLSQKCGERFTLPIEEKTIEKEIKEPVKKKRGRPKKKTQNDSIVVENVVEVVTPSQKEIPSTDISIWTDKYKPQTSEDIFGNNSSVDELKKWMNSWIEYSVEQRNVKRKRKHLITESSDEFCSDSDTRDSESGPQNTKILIGPCGSGKTSSVYALCNELNINVIELNASSKRPGKKILIDLQEATKSHHVKNTDTNSIGGFFQKQNQEDDIKKLTLLLIEDADIIYEEDEGFINALTQLIASSKRPIIITSSDPDSANIQKLLSQHKIIKYNPLSSKILGTWLQILCLIEGLRVNHTEISRLLDWNKGDIRKTLLQLQFWTLSGGDQVKRSQKPKRLINFSSSRRYSKEVDRFYDDDSSDLTWVTESQCLVENNCNRIHNSCLDCFLPYYQKDLIDFQLFYPIDLGNLWWNMSGILQNSTENIEKTNDFNSPELFNSQQSVTKTNLSELNAVGDLLDSLAFTDTIYSKIKYVNDFEPCVDYWKMGPMDSLSVDENYCQYDGNYEHSLELTQWIVENNVKLYKKITEGDIEEVDINQAMPSSEEVRYYVFLVIWTDNVVLLL